MAPRIFIVSAFLGVIFRGIESTQSALFETLKDNPELEVFLWRAAGPSSHKNDRTAWNNRPGSFWNKLWARFTGKNPIVIAQDSFFFGLLPHIISQEPDIIVIQERHLANRLYHLKRIFGLKYKIYFINGGPFAPPFPRFDHIQHPTDFYYQQSLDAGDAKEKISLIPYGENIEQNFRELTMQEKSGLRQKLSLPTDRKILLSCAALNRSHKRIHYLIEEVARLPIEIRPFVVMLGAFEGDTPGLQQLAKEKLGEGNFVMQQVPQSETKNYYQAADLFVLSSLNEGFGRVLIEAMTYGLPCLTHDYSVTRFVLGGYGYFADFAIQDQLAQLLTECLRDLSCIAADAPDRHAWAYKQYSWNVLRPQYVTNFLKVAKGK